MKLKNKINELVLIMQQFLVRNKQNSRLKTKNEKNCNEKNCNEKNCNEDNNSSILKELDIVRNQLMQANVAFNLQTNSDLIESSIYHIDALETKYNYLIKEARKRQIKNVLKLGVI